MSPRQVKKHKVVVRMPDGGAAVYPMKQWLRDHPKDLPIGMDPSGKPSANSSHELRAALKRNGWTLDMRESEVFVIKPDENGGTSYAQELIGSHADADHDNAIEEEIAEAEEITFGLERDMQLALRKNIQQLEPGLRIIDDGRERQTEAGRIDITAVDSEGKIVVIELKAGMASPEVIAQALAYMGAVAETDKKAVRCILVAGDFHKRVIFAARAVPNLMLRKYSFQFAFEAVK